MRDAKILQVHRGETSMRQRPGQRTFRPLVQAKGGARVLLFAALNAWALLGQTSTNPPSRGGFPPGSLRLERAATARVRASNEPSRSRRVRGYGRLQLSFEPNRGQFDSPIQFLARGPGYTLALKAGEAALALEKPEVRSNELAKRRNLLALSSPLDHLGPSLRIAGGQPRPMDGGPGTTVSVLRMRLVGANPVAAAHAFDQLPGEVNYYIGNDPKRWHTHIPTYATVKYQAVYPGVDLLYYGVRGEIEYDLMLEPGADPDRIHMALIAENVGSQVAGSIQKRHGTRRASEDGRPRLRIDHDGNLLVRLDCGEVSFRKPIVYQPTARGVR